MTDEVLKRLGNLTLMGDTAALVERTSKLHGLPVGTPNFSWACTPCSALQCPLT